ncbi:MAG: gliding motility-associated C-terminal domain-containing protein [Bacteroidia bacterium]
MNAELTLSFTPSKDTCNGFIKYRFYGRNNTSEKFNLLGEETNLNSFSWNKILPNKKDWQIVAYSFFSCKPNDSFKSNSVWVDISPPSYVEPDSVSVSFDNQTLIAGWTNPPDADVMGYTLFEVMDDGSNVIIDEPNVLFYEFKTSRFDPTKKNNRLAIAGFDSCRNGGVISKFHSPVHCLVQPDSRYKCNKKISVSWSPYVGWSPDNYVVVVRDKTKNTNLYSIDVEPSKRDTTLVLPYLDVTLDVFVRAQKASSSISSTSNRVEISLAGFAEPNTKTSLYFVSVENNSSIRLEGECESGDSFVLIRLSNSLPPLVLSTDISGGTVSFLDQTADVKNNINDYILIRYNDCGVAADSSNIARNILLSVNGNGDLNWSEHEPWSAENRIIDYTIQSKSSSGWKDLAQTSSVFYTPDIKGVRTWRIKATTTSSVPNNLNYGYSNDVVFDYGFDSSLLDTFFIPNVFVPEGNNTHFKIVNAALQEGESVMKIYNRWGEKLFEGDALVGWDGSNKGEVLPQGHYVFVINARYRDKIIEKSGVFLLLK